MAAEPRVELLWWRGCPSWEGALAMLREEMEAAGIDPGALEVREIRTDRDASGESFVGLADDSRRRPRRVSRPATSRSG